MRNNTSLLMISLLVLISGACQQQTEKVQQTAAADTTRAVPLYYPEVALQELFHDVQMGGVFADIKAFADCRPKASPGEILKQYREEKNAPDFSLKQFVDTHFDCSFEYNAESIHIDSLTLETRIPIFWDHLTRNPGIKDSASLSSLVPLPHRYIVPGGRFREIFYWDTYFTMEGLVVSGRLDLCKDMLDNFTYLLEQHGHIPNGNRTYFLSRSQPPFFALMVMLYGKTAGMEKALEYLPTLEKEYAFWMEGNDKLSQAEPAYRRVIQLPDGEILNRYWDSKSSPRTESYQHDVLLSQGLDSLAKRKLFRNIRAACESGWDFSTRWFKNGKDMITIATTEIIPVDLNCLLYQVEGTLAHLNQLKGDTLRANEFTKKAEKRKKAILKYFWSESQHFFVDYNFISKQHTDRLCLAGMFPLFFEVASKEQAALATKVIKEQFLFDGGLVSTLTRHQNQQWDYPNGWAPLQWIAINGLRNYEHTELAVEISQRWLALNEKVLISTGKMMEKYNVVDMSLKAGGGEYLTQDGFGWSNGVALALLAQIHDQKTWIDRK